MTNPRHGNRKWVWRFFVTLAVGCAEPYTPVSQGATGWVSDRATEIDATVEGSVEVDCAAPLSAGSLQVDLGERAARLESAGGPLFLERAQVRFEVGSRRREGASCRIPYQAHVASFASNEEVLARSGKLDAYRRSPFRQTDPGALRENPPFRAYLADGVLTVGAVFGQMHEEDLSDDDEGFWSTAVFEAHWTRMGLSCRRGFGEPGRCEGAVGDMPVRVTYLGPDLFGVRGSRHKQQRLEDLVRSSDILYVNGHAFQDGLEPLYDPGAYADGEPRLVMLDLCWASLWMLPDLHRSLEGRRVDVIATPRRVVTGSVASFTLLTDAVVEAALAGEERTWGTVLREMNAAAQTRADERWELVDGSLREPEIYGVSRIR